MQEPEVQIEQVGGEPPDLKPFTMPHMAFPVLISAGPVRLHIHADGSIEGDATMLEHALRQAPADQMNPMTAALLALTLNAMKRG